MNGRIKRGGLDIAEPLVRFVEEEALPHTGLEAERFWLGVSAMVGELRDENRALLARRDSLQSAIDDYHRASPGAPDPAEYKRFLRDIGYIVDEPGAFTIDPRNVDSEITAQAGPQLVVPVSNARFAVNAANARWGSLYDALYGTDAVDASGALAPGTGYNRARGDEVIARGRTVLDSSVRLQSASHADVTRYSSDAEGFVATLSDGGTKRLLDPSQFVGRMGDAADPTALLFVNNGLHIEVQIDRGGAIGAADPAGVNDLLLESAVSTIMDFEDSVAAVDVDDKVAAYRNWLGLMTGAISEEVVKNGRSHTRSMNPDRVYTAADGAPVVLPGRSLLLARVVGHLMKTDMIVDEHGDEVGEGIVDTIMTALCALHELAGRTSRKNSRTGSLYIVKPKMHGPDEVAFAVKTFERVESLLGLTHGTIKIGIMDEERRTTLNLKASIVAAKDRVVFINTGFLDRTGDEIHTSMHAGVVCRKADIKSQPFIRAYEEQNVDVGLSTGFAGRAQIGKGMWAMPDQMAAMLAEKGAHPRAGATTAWVPSPTAATLHALHYHETDVRSVQQELLTRTPSGIDPILTIPLAEHTDWSDSEKQEELDNNVQSILGYVVRWIDQGIGCSKVPDLHDVALMEDRATLRISSQLLANWLTHGVITESDVTASLHRQASVVDRQNSGDPFYSVLVGANGPGIAFQAAEELILRGADQPNGYTEPILHRARRLRKLSATA